MKRIFLRVSVLLFIVILGIQAISAQEPIEFEPFSDEAHTIEGVIPAGWTPIGNGLYAENPQAPVTLVALQSAPLGADAVLSALLPQFGLTEAPESVGTYEGTAFTFTLYQIDVAGMRIDLGLAFDGRRTVIALLQTTPEEYDVLHEAVFLPIMTEVKPLETEHEEVPYIVEDVTFDNGDITLAGTLTIPEGEGPFPAVVLMTGSGPQDRDEIVVAGFPIFRLIADGLTREGVAVLRYDDRGVSASTGVWEEASMDDFASDALAGVDYLLTRDEIEADKIGLFGHSEGGVYAFINAAKPDTEVAFIISMAGLGVSGKDLLLQQNRDIIEQAGGTEAQVQSQLDLLEAIFPHLANRDYDALSQTVYDLALEQYDTLTPEELMLLGGMTAEEFATYSTTLLAQQANEPFASLLDFDPNDYFDQITMPVLAIFGGLDIQVSAELNAQGLEEGLAHNDDLTIIIIEDANHLFQSAVTGSMEEYETLEKAFTPEFIPSILDWMQEQGILQ